MLVDVEFKKPAPHMAMILGIIGSGGTVVPERIGKGMYQCGHWSIDQFGLPIRERWREENAEYLDFEDYGVCDTPEQAIEHLKLESRPENFFVSFVKIEKATQPADGGWRWHKWGPYIGTKEPQCEYIHDEPDIDAVYTYHVYELQR
jgi:hypothetical protein